jgi:hypothetical protein
MGFYGVDVVSSPGFWIFVETQSAEEVSTNLKILIRVDNPSDLIHLEMDSSLLPLTIPAPLFRPTQEQKGKRRLPAL